MTILGEADGRWRAGGIGLVWSVRTDVGLHRRVNEDSAAAIPPVFVVADGMGGHAAGDLASERAVRRFAAAAEAVAPGAQEIRSALIGAGEDIDALSDELGVDAGTTATGLVVHGHDLLVFNVGDSRVYSILGGRLRQVTIDHSLVQELIDAGQLDPEEAEYHPAANVITKALGFRERPDPDLVSVAAEPGLRMLLCSDGLTKELDAERLRLLLCAGLAADVTADSLVEAAIAAGGHDNVTVIVIDVVADRSDAEGTPPTGV